MKKSISIWAFFIFLICSKFSSLNILHANDATAIQLVEHVKKSIENAEKGNSKLSKEVLNLSGMSSAKVRHFLNNLCSAPNIRYLEIGCWKGSTLISALYGNYGSIKDAVAIDNWSKFGGPKELFLQNCKKFIPMFPLRFYEIDSFEVDTKAVFPLPINVYFYDGDHSALSQELALTYYNEILDDVFVVIIDDWNRKAVQSGTREAFKKLNYEILYKVALPSFRSNDQENWWNGIFVAVVRKQKL